MKLTIRVVFTLLIVSAIALVAIFQNDLKGYEKVDRINEWVLYYNDIENETGYKDYIVKSGFEEKRLDEAIIEGLFTETELELIDQLIEEFEEWND